MRLPSVLATSTLCVKHSPVSVLRVYADLLQSPYVCSDAVKCSSQISRRLVFVNTGLPLAEGKTKLTRAAPKVWCNEILRLLLKLTCTHREMSSIERPPHDSHTQSLATSDYTIEFMR